MAKQKTLFFLMALLVLLCAVQLLAHEHTHSHGGHGHVHAHDHDHDHGHDHDDHHHDHRHWYSKPKEEVVEEDHGHVHSHKDLGHSHEDHGHVHSHEDHGHVHSHEDHGHVHAHDDHHGHTHDHGDHGHVHAHDDHGHTHSHGEEAHGHTHDHADHGHTHSHGDDDHGHVHSEIRPAYPVKKQREGVWGKAIGATAVVCAAPVFILPFIPIGNKPAQGDKLLNTLLAFAAGGLLGDVFLHLLPHALDPHHHHGEDTHSHSHSHSHSEGAHDHSHSTAVGLWVMVGLTAFFVLEKAMRAYSGEGGHGHSHSQGHSHAEKKEPAKGEKKDDKKEEKKEEAHEEHHIKVAGYLNLVADFSHNFTDGLAIGASYLVSDNVGFTTTLAILMHEVPHEIGDFAILVQSGFSKQRAMMAQFSTAIGAMVGCILGLMAKDLAESTLWILPLTAGGFIYIATVSVLPELLNDTSMWQTIKELIAMAVGVGFMVVIAAYE